MSRIIIAFYGLLFPFIILSIIMAIITIAAEEKVITFLNEGSMIA